MFKTIVVGLDGSDGAKHALEFADALAKRDGASLVLANIAQDVVGRGVSPVRQTDTEIQKEIEGQAEKLRSEGVDATVEIRSAFFAGPGQGIAEIADESGADLIIVGTRGYSAAVGIVVGSVTHRLLHMAKQSVLVVPEQARLRAE